MSRCRIFCATNLRSSRFTSSSYAEQETKSCQYFDICYSSEYKICESHIYVHKIWSHTMNVGVVMFMMLFCYRKLQWWVGNIVK